MNAAAAQDSPDVLPPFEGAVPPGERLAAQSGPLARAASVLAGRFGRGGMALTYGIDAGVPTARGIAAGFARPGAPGRRALPALALDPAYGDIARQVRRLANPCDVMIAVVPSTPTNGTAAPLNAAAVLGLPIIALTASGAGYVGDVTDHVIASSSASPLLTAEFHTFTHDVLEHLVHLALVHRPPVGLGPAAVPDARLVEAARVRAAELAASRAGLLRPYERRLSACATVLARALTRGSRLFVVDDGDDRYAETVARAFAAPSHSGAAPLPVLSPHGGASEPGDVTLALFTGDDTAEMVSILAAARWKSQLTLAFTGPAGQNLRRGDLADHVLVVPDGPSRRVRETHLTWSSALWEFTHRALRRPPR
ncbi:hypothetical protein [Spirillospora sp. NPDC047279]|uniref:hypothetical protein n=1 Tax=Spirillospora sp. NPDC047279 TaxID=3155478 RepID=UPI0033FEED25